MTKLIAITQLHLLIKDSTLRSRAFFKDNNLKIADSTIISKEQSQKISRIITDKTSVISGSLTNTVFGLDHFGSNVTIMCAVGNDEYGHTCIEGLKETNIKGTPVIIENTDSDHCYYFLDRQKERTMAMFFGTSNSVKPEHFDLDSIKNYDCLLLEGYFLKLPGKKALVEKAMDIAEQNNVKIAMALSSEFVVNGHKDFFLKNMHRIDVLSGNRVEFIPLFKDLGVNEGCVINSRNNKTTFVVTDSENGSHAFKNGEIFFAEAKKIKKVSAIGAGDAFLAGFYKEYFSGNDLENCLKTGNECGAKVVASGKVRLDLANKKDGANIS